MQAGEAIGEECEGPLHSLAGNLVFPEGPRWHSGRLWFSDMEDMRVRSVGPGGDVRDELVLDDYPSGLGWLPDGTLLVVSVKRRQVLALANGEVRVHADLARHALSYANDMVVDSKGRAYVGSMGFDIWADPEFKPGNICRVDPDGSVRVVADRLAFPNGSVIMPDGRTLIVAESLGGKLTAFSIAEDGSLGEARTWAEMEGETPDGICLDAAGGIWVASAIPGRVLRYEAGGRVTHHVRLPEGRSAFAVALGGADGRDLFLAMSSVHGDTREARLSNRPGSIMVARAPYPGAQSE